MKASKITAAAFAALILLSGCTDRQMQGTMAGGSLGAIFGSSIGGLMGGPRGSDAGTALGMAVGAVVGNAVTSPKARKANSNIDECDDSSNAPYSSRHPAAGGNDRYVSHIEGLKVENIRFVDENRNQTIDAGEHAKVLLHGKHSRLAKAQGRRSILQNSFSRRNAHSYIQRFFAGNQGCEVMKI